MQRYHDVNNDPLPLHSPAHEIERARLASLTQAFLDSGGEIEQVGFRMSDTPSTFVINPQQTPLYAYLFTSLTESEKPFIAPDVMTEKVIGLIRAAASRGDAPKRIAERLHLTEKRLRQLARDYYITLHAQR